jgi:hypothetical protein
MDEVASLESPYNGKKKHFLLMLKSGKGIHLKTDSQQETDKWVQALRPLIEIYSGKQLVDFDINRQYKDKVDSRIANIIMEEIESEEF